MKQKRKTLLSILTLLCCMGSMAGLHASAYFPEEVEPNDTMETAMEAGLVYGGCGGNNVDYYYEDARALGYLYFSFGLIEVGEYTLWHFDVLNEEGETIHTESMSTSETYGTSFRLEEIPAGRYYVRISCESEIEGGHPSGNYSINCYHLMYGYLDPNGDGECNANDAALVLQHAAEVGSGAAPTLTDLQVIQSDYNEDGVADAEDAGLILERSARYGV